MFQNISIIGGGYVGLSTGVLFSETHNLTILDIDRSRVSSINNRQSYFAEKDIAKILENPINKIQATTDYDTAMQSVDLVILALPTNFDYATNSFNTEKLEDAIKKLDRSLNNVPVVIKSTIPLGFTENMSLKYQNNPIIFIPEFLREGFSIFDNRQPSRIVIGDTSELAKELGNLFLSIAKNEPPVFFMSSSEAELVKLASNSFLALKVAYFNEIDSYCLRNNLKASNVIEGVSSDKRIGNSYNNPSFGFGGYCLPKDTKQLSQSFQYSHSSLIDNINKSNIERIAYLSKYLSKLDFKTLGVYRINSKANADNLRDSSTIEIIKLLKSSKKEILIYEPLIKATTFDGCQVVDDIKIFKDLSDLIICNRIDASLDDVANKIFSRDIYHKD